MQKAPQKIHRSEELAVFRVLLNAVSVLFFSRSVLRDRAAGLAGAEALLVGLKKILEYHGILFRGDLASCLMEDLGLGIAYIGTGGRVLDSLQRLGKAGGAGGKALALGFGLGAEFSRCSLAFGVLASFRMVGLGLGVGAQCGVRNAETGQQEYGRQDKSAYSFHDELLIWLTVKEILSGSPF